ncbi:MAG: XRE family transcriptional regulator [Clostridia bacterium]|nr:XRE family transcriptional regulator [Clostridia bacterium]
MLLNDTRKDFKTLCIQNDVTQKVVAEKSGISINYMSQVIARDHVDKMFIRLMEGLGYDIKIEYIKK